MNKIIVTTTINAPTEATLKFANMSNWHLIVVGDTKTPHNLYKGLKNITYLSPEDQEILSKELSDSIGWRSIRRRNLGYLKAYQMGADIMATVDDDNIPLENWGEELFIGENMEVDYYETDLPVFDPIFVTEHKELWHRGFPLQLVSKRSISNISKKQMTCLVQADFWNGDPDIDAVCRITKMPEVEFKHFKPFSSNKISPFNSQNTFIHRDLIPYYMVIPHIGRMDDIWGAYAIQQDFKEKFGDFVLYNKPTVYQARNPHDLTIDMEEEMIGYKYNMQLLESGYRSVLPENSRISYEIYKNSFNK
jgi:hypothetical protein